jgi:hypothetical protein
MKKILLVLTFLLSIQFQTQAQAKLEDFGRIILNTYLPDNNAIPAEAKKALETKLNQITTINGMGGSAVNPRFIITAVLNVGTKDIIPGPPQMIAQNIDVTLLVGDAITNTVFSNTVVSIKGVGTNENKSLIDAIKNINPKNKDISAFLEEGKNKIISYYTTQCDFIIKDAETLAKQQKFNEAIYKLSVVPEVCKECYFKTSELVGNLFQQKIDSDCKAKLAKAKLLWSGQQNQNKAEEVIGIISEVHPNANCYTDVSNFAKQISNKLKADEKAKLELGLKKYNDKIATEKQQINAYKEIAVEYAKNQPRTITYNNIYWK